MAMARNEGPGRRPEERGPSASLAWVFVAIAAVCIAAAGLRLGPWAAVSALGVGAVCFAAGRFAGVASGFALGARARAELHDRLIAAEGQIVRSQLTALRAPTGGDDKALMAEIARREDAERLLEEERAQRRSTSDQSQTSIDEERRQRLALQDQAHRAIAEERRQRQVVEEQAKQIIADERKRGAQAAEQVERAAEEQRKLREAAELAERALADERKRGAQIAEHAERALADERRRRQSAEEQLDRAQRSAAVESQALRSAAAVAQREAERLSTQQNGALREVERVLAPYIEREKLLLDLAKIEAGPRSRSDLPAILDTIATKASFGSIVLSDESGLPVAASRGTRDPEGTAGTSSLLFTLADRLVAHGHPQPIAVLVHDEANETILHRLFRAGTARYLLTATGRSRGVVPETLDPTLDTIERALLHETWAS